MTEKNECDERDKAPEPAQLNIRATAEIKDAFSARAEVAKMPNTLKLTKGKE